VLEHLQGAKPPGGFSMRVMLLLSLPLLPFVLIHVLPYSYRSCRITVAGPLRGKHYTVIGCRAMSKVARDGTATGYSADSSHPWAEIPSRSTQKGMSSCATEEKVRCHFQLKRCQWFNFNWK
jgi:hypothetical protein